MSFVRKKKNAESLDGVACHKKTKSVGSQTDFCLMARKRAAACSDTTCFGLLSAPETIYIQERVPQLPNPANVKNNAGKFRTR